MSARSPTPRLGRVSALTQTVLVLLTLCEYVSSEVLAPPYFNLAEGKKVYADHHGDPATCGDDGPDLYCKLVGANAERDTDSARVIQGQICDTCDMRDPLKRHPPEYAVDATELWWQSPPLSRGSKYNEVNLTIDLGQEFHVAYVFVRMGNSPRPGIWALEKSRDFGKTYVPWQYFADSPQNCETYFGKESLQRITRDDSVICSTEFSQIVPLEGGEIPISLLNNRPSANMYFNSSVLQEWTRATNVRLRLIKTKTLYAHLMSVARQDPSVTRRYFYSIKDISIGGRCMCNGHADQCDPAEENFLKCRCQHNTCGPQCTVCCPGFEQKKWRISQNWNQFSCEPCNCHNHTSKCKYDAEVDAKRLSLDIHGNYEGGGVCQECQHNTEGINCNKCKATFYRPYNKLWNESDVCQPCNCNLHNLTGSCEEGSGKCECRQEYQPPNCDQCRFGYYGYPHCKPCPCNINGTNGGYCSPIQGDECQCKYNYAGQFCFDCADGYYSNQCKECECQSIGSVSTVCDKTSGNCTCKSKFSGRTCDQCEAGYYNYPNCDYCNCDTSGTVPSICDATSGQCLCKEGFGGERCDQCIAGYYMEVVGRARECVPCNCSTVGSASTSCAATGKCTCLSNFGGKQCDQCSPGHYKYPTCLPCDCDQYGSIGVSCDDNGRCQCKKNFHKEKCNVCKEHFYNYPACEECNCDPNGVIASFAGCGSVPAGELCQCKSRVQGRICNDCKPLFWNLQEYNPNGCEDCGCSISGTQAGIGVCDTKSGQCSCKMAVGGRACTQCQDGYYNLTSGNLFGCTECDCDIGGSVDNNCEKTTGQCKCHSRIEGRRCDRPIQQHYFPTLHQFQYEVENGRTPSNGKVRYDFNEQVFPGYSWEGYAVFGAPLLTEVINDIQIYKASVYRMVIRYVNPGRENVVASVFLEPDNPSHIYQKSSVVLKPTTEPQFVTVSEEKGTAPSHIVLDPGKWQSSIKTNKNVLIDYFVLIPQAYYEATILTKQVEQPCTIGQQKLCRQFAYPSVDHFPTVKGNRVINAVNELIDNPQQLSALEAQPLDIPIVSESQEELNFEITVDRPGLYTFLLEYVTPVNSTKPTGGTITVKVSSTGDTKSESYSVVNLNECPYAWACRQVLLDDLNKVLVITLHDELNHIFIQSDAGTLAGIKSIVAIPESEWSLDYITPRSFCVKKNGECTPAVFSAAVDSKKVEFESISNAENVSEQPFILDNATQVIHLKPRVPTQLVLATKVSKPGVYVFVVHYYQPDHPGSVMPVTINGTDGQVMQASLPLAHCPSNSGCRALIRQPNGNTRFNVQDNITLILQQGENGIGVWMDYLLIVAAQDYVDTILKEANALDYTREFIKKCAQNHYKVNITDQGFCRDSIFSITSNHNNGALECLCDPHGSSSYKCNTFGGQCDCKPNVVGRTCRQCRPGYYGFPNCRPCDCPSRKCADDGTCVCPPNVIGERCERCKPETYGYDIIGGCHDCNCHALGVVGNKLQCDSNNGSCECKDNVEGRMCDKCVAGNYAFPYCSPCSCHRAGTNEDVCDQNTAECFCKANVGGNACDTCLDGHYNLQAENPEGCTKCFCFGKTTRCSNSYHLFWAQLNGMEDWYLATIEVNKTVTVNRLSTAPQVLNATGIGAELTSDEAIEKTVYFGAPQQFLGHKLESYGGYLNYTIFYTTGPFGKAIAAADVIIEGPNGFLVHNSFEQPPATTHWTHSLHIIESEFSTIDDGLVSREQLMTTLSDVKSLYIRATYWESSVTTRLESGTMDVGLEMDWAVGLVSATSVETCSCPSAYKGLSCEQCADGHYRLDTGPHGGFCVPCQCNGHSNKCDVNTGICLDCQHDTTGDHCEQCITGYHGNATVGTPYDCIICACPLDRESNNFASSCMVDETGTLISCECPVGYMGARCEFCAAGYYGEPETIGDYCKPCNCSGNIDVGDPGSCDTHTGDCLKCTNNAWGEACHICQPGFYGDAIFLKNCQACICDENGMDYCDNTNGRCVCKPGVVGEKCDRCAVDHWGLSSGRGCTPCDCGAASETTQCEENTGRCRCKSGVSGPKCDQCAAGFWNYTKEGCDHCNCNTGYSAEFRCNERTGHCECLPGAVGSKCEKCPHRWVLIPRVRCEPCDSCTDDLLDSIEELNRTLAPVALEFKFKATSFFTTQRLHYIDETTKRLKPDVELLKGGLLALSTDLASTTAAIDELENKAKNLDRSSQYSKDDSLSNVKRATDLVSSVRDILRKVHESKDKAHEAVQHVADLAVSLELGEQPKIDSALDDAKQIKNDIMEKDFSLQLNRSEEMLQNARNLEERMKVFVIPVYEQNKTFHDLSEKVKSFGNKLKKMRAKTEEIDNTINKGVDLNERTHPSKIASKVNAVNKENQRAYEDVVNTAQLLVNASIAQAAASQILANITTFKEDTSKYCDETEQLVENYKTEKLQLYDKVNEAEQHAAYLRNKADELAILLNHLNNSKTEDAYRAASSYSSIVKMIQDAKNAIKAAEEAINNVTQIETEKVQNNNALARSIDITSRLESDININELLPKLNAAESSVAKLKEQNNTAHKHIDAIETFLSDKIPSSLEKFISLRETMMPSQDLMESSQKFLSAPENAFLKNLAGSRKPAQDLYTDAANVNKNIRSIENQINNINRMQPGVESLIDEVDKTKSLFDKNIRNADANLKKLKEKIQLAKDIASRITVGVTFDEKSTLQPETPSNVDEMGTSTHVSAFFRTKEENGFILYLGNPEGTQLRRTRSDDFMALEIENGFPYLLIDIGDSNYGREPARINSNKKVSDNKWYQVIVDRVSKNVKLTIREALSNGTEISHTTERILPGEHTIFNLDKDQSKLYVGGYPSHAKIQSQVRYSAFNGAIEEVVIGDTPVGLWNFQKAESLKGVRHRNTPTSVESGSGYRFNGEGYAIYEGRTLLTSRESLNVDLRFRTYAPDGLLFLVGDSNTFLSLEMREGNLFLQFKLDSGIVTIGTTRKFNDGQWHTVDVKRYLKTGSLKVDSYPVETGESNGAATTMPPTKYVYFGGLPSGMAFTEITNRGFDGCIDNVGIMNTALDLTQNSIQVKGVTIGCQFPNLVSLSGVGSYLELLNSSSADVFQISLKFRSASPEGLIFYSANRDQSTGISLALHDGKLVLRSNKEVLDTGSNTYNDDQWHVVTATHNPNALTLVIDDYDKFSTDSPPQPLHIMNGELFLGGARPNYMIVSGMTATRVSLAGCLGDVTLNGQVIHFPSAVSFAGATIGRCGAVTSTSGVVSETAPAITTVNKSVLPPVIFESPTTELQTDAPVSFATDAPTAAPTAPPPPTTKRPPPVVVEGCALGFDPSFADSSPESGYRFGTRNDSRIEFGRLPARQSTEYDISLAFNTTQKNGLMFYAKHTTLKYYVALILSGGKLHLFYNCGNYDDNIVAPELYNDGVWHEVRMTMDDGRAKLTVNEVLVGEMSSQCNGSPPILQKPFFFGGLSSINVVPNREIFGSWNYTPFDGCMRDLKVNSNPITDITAKVHVLPCRQSSEEQGVFFRPPGGYIKLMERFKVGTDISIQLEIKARNSSGLLVSVHGRKDYLILEIIDNEVVLRVENGKGPFEAVFNLGSKHFLCDGKWHTIYAIKSRHVVSLVVDGHFSDAGVGLSASADTRSALFIGGHPSLHHSLRGVRSRHGFTGCIRNIRIRDNQVPINLNSVFGSVSVGMCPTD